VSFPLGISTKDREIACEDPVRTNCLCSAQPTVPTATPSIATLKPLGAHGHVAVVRVSVPAGPSVPVVTVKENACCVCGSSGSDALRLHAPATSAVRQAKNAARLFMPAIASLPFLVNMVSADAMRNAAAATP
jgi:hypothetical protein